MIDIFGTLGPSCDNEEVLTGMFREGMTGIRINLSHVMLADCRESIGRIQRAAKAIGITPKILIDMQGPELRIGAMKNPLELREGDSLVLVSSYATATGNPVPNTAHTPVPIAPEILTKLSAGQEVLLDDGKILASVIRAKENATELKVMRGGTLKGRKSIAIKGLKIDDMPALTECDMENLKHASQLGITGVMQPFVRSAEDLKTLRRTVDTYSEGDKVKIYAKIENLEGVENLTTFFPYADEIIIARGDLGNAMPLWELPRIQKSISKTCRNHNMPFMVVTQMLSSMEHSKVPTRAEVSDIYNAVIDGASSVMVTGETAVGENPIEVIGYLARTAKEASCGNTSRK